MKDGPRYPLCVLSVFTAATLLSACEESNRYVAPPPPQVAVAHPAQQKVTEYLEATGSLAAVNTVDLVARVAGFVEAIDYKDGTAVKKGTPLFAIEREPYKLKFDQSKAAEEGAKAALVQSEAEFKRQQDPPRPIMTRRWRSATPTSQISNRRRSTPKPPPSITATRW
jgi:multidrug efflux pump subunit AcrA (membrane-fusion protein)